MKSEIQTTKNVYARLAAFTEDTPVDSIGGTNIYATTYNAGSKVWTKQPDGTMANVPADKYETDNGFLITVSEESQIVAKSAK